MKIALCLSGLPRQVEETYPYLKKAILDRYDVDVFAHSWLEDPWRNGSHEKYVAPKSEYEVRMNEVTKILRLYKPKAFTVGQYHIRQESYQSNPDYILYTRYCSMFESVFLANELKKRYEEQNHFKYDCVIRCRYDYGLITEFDFSSFDIANRIFVKKVDQNPAEQINCAFAFSSSQNMDIWCDLFNHMHEMAEIVIKENSILAEMYKRTRNGPDTHVLLAFWNRVKNLNATPIQFDAVSWRVGGAIQFE